MKKENATITIQTLKTAIREKKTKRLYVFHGEETFLLNHYLGQLRKNLIDEITESFNFRKFTNENFSVQELVDCVECLPVMAENTMIVVEDVDIFKLAELERTKLAEIFADIPQYCTIVFTYITLQWKLDERYKKFYSIIIEHAAIVEFAKQDRRDLVSWVTRHFAANKKSVTPQLCGYLIDITDGTMTSLAGEILKICAYSGTDTITKSDIDAVTEPVPDAVVMQMTELMGVGEYGSAMVKLQQLLKKQEPPLSILSAIGGHFRRISTAKTLLDNGEGVAEFMSIYKCKDYYAKRFISIAGKFSAEFLHKVAELILETDYQMKTSFDDPERLLELLVLRISQEAKNG